MACGLSWQTELQLKGSYHGPDIRRQYNHNKTSSRIKFSDRVTLDTGQETTQGIDIRYMAVKFLPQLRSFLSRVPENHYRFVPKITSAVIMSSGTSTFTTDLGAMRIKYKDKSETFTEDQLITKEPFGQFKEWFDVASKTPGIQEPNAMCLGTATKDGLPSVRPVLLKGFSSEGFKFYTNYGSRKGRELSENPNAALTFFWEPLRRTVRIEGRVEKTSAEDSDAYFESRPFPSQIGAHASKQSAVIGKRETLMIKERELLARFSEGKVERPECWGGYIVIPHSVEFWQGQSDRLHDRIRFRRPKAGEKIDNVFVHQGENGWVYERLSP